MTESSENTEEKPATRDRFGRWLPGVVNTPQGRPRRGESLLDRMNLYLDMPLADLEALDISELSARDATVVEQIRAGIGQSWTESAPAAVRQQSANTQLSSRIYTLNRVGGTPAVAITVSSSAEEQADMLSAIAAALLSEQSPAALLPGGQPTDGAQPRTDADATLGGAG